MAQRRLRTVSVAFLIACCFSSTALADARTEARRHFRHGMELVVQGQVDAGVAELEEAYNILPHPNVLYNIGRAYAEAGRYEDARDYFDRYLETDPPDREEVRAILAAVDERIAARQAIQAAAQHAAESGTTSTAADASSSVGTVVAGPAASDDQLALIDGALQQVQGLCAATGSAQLCERAQQLVRLREELARSVAAAEPSGDENAVATTPVTGDDTSGTTPAVAEAQSLSVGESTSGEAAYVEQVDAAARVRSSPLDAPASTTIITRQDIRLSGVMNVGELLRRAAGVSVMTPTPGASNVGIRGFNRLLSPRVLMLVNGRTTYVDPLGTPFWDTASLQVEDIERIEIIRGPASVLYGANGFSGIVNIVLRAPGDDAGTEFNVGAGNHGQLRGHVSTSGRVGDLSYRFHGGFQQMDRFAQPITPGRVDRQVGASDPSLAQRETIIGGQLRYRASDDVTLVAEGGVMYANAYNFYATGAFLDFYASGPNSYVSMSMLTPHGRVRTFYNRFAADILVNDGTIDGGTFANNTFDVEGEFTRQFHLVVDHDLHLGVNYRLKNVDWTFLPAQHTEHHLGVFLEDTMRLGDKVRLVAALRMDHHPLLPQLMFSPRGAIIIRPTEGQSFRLTAGTAFRSPSMQDTYVSLLLPTPVTAVGAAAIGSDEARRILGRNAINPERILSVELGYQNQESDYFAFDVSAYYNRVDGLIAFDNNTNVLTLANYAQAGLPGAVGAAQLAGFNRTVNQFVYGQTQMQNEPEVYHVFGGEAGVRTFPIDGLDVYANYALNQTRVTKSPVGQQWDHRTSTHMLNAGVQYRSSFGLDLSADFHYATSTRWPELAITATGIERQLLPNPAYYLLNARVGMRLLGDRLELAVAGWNITNLQRTQHPYGQQVDARVMGTVSARF